MRQPRPGTQATASRHSSHCPLLLRASEAAVCQAGKCIKCSVAAWTKDSSQCTLVLRASEAAVCQPANASNAPWQLGPRTQASALWFYKRASEAAVCQGRKCIKCSVAASTKDSSQCALVLRASEAAVCQPANASNAPWQLGRRTQASALCL